MDPQQRRRNPFAGVVDFVNDVTRGFGLAHREINDSLGGTPQIQARTEADAWIPATDIAASGNHLVIVMDLAGVADEDIDITYTMQTLTVSGQRRSIEDQLGFGVPHPRTGPWPFPP